MEFIWNTGITWNIFFQSLGPFLKIPMEIFSFFGTETFFLLLLPAIYWCIDSKTGMKVGLILLLSASVKEALKLAFHGPRPYWYSKDVISYAAEKSFGVPSGHSQTSIVVFGMLAAIIKKKWVWFASGILIIIIGISRLYLGVHFPHDVLLGWLIGAILLWVMLHFWEPAVNRLKKMSMTRQVLLAFLTSMFLILLALIPFLWLKITNWQLPQAWAEYGKSAVSLNESITSAGVLFGFLTGLSWLNIHGGFNAKGNLLKRILCYILGMAGMLVFYIGLKVIFGFFVPDSESIISYILRYIRYFLVGIWISGIAPWFFIKLKLAKNAL